MSALSEKWRKEDGGSRFLKTKTGEKVKHEMKKTYRLISAEMSD